MPRINASSISRLVAAVLVVSSLNFPPILGLSRPPASSPLRDVYDRAYDEITPPYCSRLAFKDGYIGCAGAKDGGIVGVLSLANSLGELQSVLKQASKSQPIVVLLSSALFQSSSREALTDLEAKSSYVAGVLVMHGGLVPGGFSPARSRPSREWDLHPLGTFEWNPLGNSASFEAFSFPVVFLDSDQSDSLYKRAVNNKVSGTQTHHSAQLSYFMQSGHQDSKSCLEQSQCLPLGGYSVWASLGGAVVPAKETVFGVAGFDSSSFSHGLASGAEGSMSGTVALLAAGKALHGGLGAKLSTMKRQINLAFFNGEAWGYLGSRKFVMDMQSFECRKMKDQYCVDPPADDLTFMSLDFTGIAAVLEAKQVGNVTQVSSESLYGYREAHSSEALWAQVRAAANASQSSGGVLVSDPKADTGGIPPSSTQSFVAANSSIAHVVLTDHDGAYKNQAYDSQFDTLQNTNASQICQTATVMARALYVAASDDSATSATTLLLRADCGLVEELMNCLVGQECTPAMSKYILGASGVGSSYVGVFSFTRKSHLSEFFNKFLSDMTAFGSRNSRCGDDDDCDDGEVCLAGNVCVRGYAHYHQAISPGFEFDQDAWEWKIVDEKQPLWTESFWGDDVGTAVFLVESTFSEWMMFIVGVLLTAATTAGLMFARRFTSVTSFLSHRGGRELSQSAA